MAKFSLLGDEEDDEGPSCPALKRPRFDYAATPFSSDDDQPSRRQEEQEEDDDVQIDGENDDFIITSPRLRGEWNTEDGAGEENSELNVDSISADANQEDPRPLSTNSDRSISVFLTDPDVLDCCICFEALTIPVFQCENGHIACSSCCTKLGNKCPSCSWPIGYNRCRAIEKVLESVKIACQNKQYGCKEMVSYSEKKDHEKTCTHAPCSCPLTSCNFISSAKQLYQHFHSQHADSAVLFQYNCDFTVTLNEGDKFLVLQERDGDGLFILNNETETLGNLVSVSCIGPYSFGKSYYNLLAKCDGNTLRLESFATCTQGQADYSLSSVYLLIPPRFFGSSGQLKLDLFIERHDQSPGCSERSVEAA